MVFILFLICLLASSIGAIVGAGGGVIIKPVMDLFGLMPVSTVSFLSGATVLCMSIVSLIRTWNSGAKVKLKTSTPLAIGAVAGGLVGKWLLETVKSGFGNEKTLGMIQAIALTVITFLVFLYVCNKNKLPSKHVESPFVAVIIGCCLGIISSFLGIGGGTSNVAVLFFFFSMEAKEAAKNSIYIIVFSQLASIITSAVSGTIPSFQWYQLVAMVAGGVGGALVGAEISKRINNQKVELLLKILLIVITCIDFYNIIKFAFLV